MTRSMTRAFCVVAIATVCAAATPVSADLGDCAQPVSSGVAPVASDCLFILNVAVGAKVLGSKSSRVFAGMEALLEAEEQANRWTEARQLLPTIDARAATLADTASVAWHRAFLEARAGTPEAARIAIARYEGLALPNAHPPSRTKAYGAARLYAAVGDTVMALVRLREAYQLGDEILRSYSIWHRELDPAVRELPAFKQLVGSPR